MRDASSLSDAEQRRETFAWFGAASYRAQCVEKQLAILLASTYNPEFLRTRPELRDHFFDRELGKTMGQLVAALRSRISVAIDLEDRLNRAAKLRNWLAHDYFWERAIDILKRGGRAKMIAELRAAADDLGELDGELTSIAEAWFVASGGDTEALKAELEQIWSTVEDGQDRRGAAP